MTLRPDAWCAFSAFPRPASSGAKERKYLLTMKGPYCFPHSNEPAHHSTLRSIGSPSWLAMSEEVKDESVKMEEGGGEESAHNSDQSTAPTSHLPLAWLLKCGIAGKEEEEVEAAGKEGTGEGGDAEEDEEEVKEEEEGEEEDEGEEKEGEEGEDSNVPSPAPAKFELDKAKRFEFLLKQTEIFSHFMSTGNKKDGASPKKGPGRPKKVAVTLPLRPVEAIRDGKR